jgi:hypothetical protein
MKRLVALSLTVASAALLGCSALVEPSLTAAPTFSVRPTSQPSTGLPATPAPSRPTAAPSTQEPPPQTPAAVHVVKVYSTPT